MRRYIGHAGWGRRSRSPRSAASPAVSPPGALAAADGHPAALVPPQAEAQQPQARQQAAENRRQEAQLPG